MSVNRQEALRFQWTPCVAALVLVAVLILPGAAIAQNPGDTFRDCPDCPEMVVVPAGSFMMGSDSGDDAQRPRHEVTIRRPFAVGKYEVTFREWDACVRGGGCKGYKPGDEGWGRGSRPVINVSREDAWSYALWLYRKTDRRYRYRLLSEAEWEYAARAGTTTAYHFGSAITPYDANFNKLEGRTVSVGSYPPNAWGLHDMHGNVWEWVEDCYRKSYRGAPTDGRPWQGGGCHTYEGKVTYVLRGGSWVNAPGYLRSAYRGRSTAGGRDGDFGLGFRVARTVN